MRETYDAAGARARAGSPDNADANARAAFMIRGSRDGIARSLHLAIAESPFVRLSCHCNDLQSSLRHANLQRIPRWTSVVRRLDGNSVTRDL